MTVRIDSKNMVRVNSFTFNYFSENTYVLHDDTGECLILDPGCSTASEQQELRGFIDNNNLKPVALVNTHGHIDHILGNAWVAQTWDLPLQLHADELTTIAEADVWARMFGLSIAPMPEKKMFLTTNDRLRFGNTELEILFTPGHSRASLSFYHAGEKLLMGGDVLFFESIGRTDLPGGNMETLLNSIRTQLYVLPDDVRVYPGHGPATTIGHEKMFNPFTS